MRLIDADALLKEWYEIYVPEDPEALFSYPFTHKVVSVEDVKNAPTIEAEPVKHGEWERIPFSYVGGYRCSVCGCKSLEKHWHYCPKCGAKMDGGNDHD